MFNNRMKPRFVILSMILTMALMVSSCSFKVQDEKPPSAPLLTVTSIGKEAVSLAWSESYDNEGIDGYKLYRDGEVLAEVNKTEYKDKDIKIGSEYEYYVVALDEAGNRSSKSVKQRVKVSDDDENQKVQNNKELNIQKLSRSTIKLYTLDNDLNIIAMGSGTIINKEGYILTNFHCVGENESGNLYNKDGYVAVAVTDDIKKNIQPQYIAQYKSGVANLDLSVVKIAFDINWNKVSAADLNLIPAIISNSDSVVIGDDINILGYPGVGGETITFTAGRVSGFLDDDNDNEIDWIKTDAVVNHGNSGGTAINKNGEMIGIPTAKTTGEDNDVMFYLKPVNQALSIMDDAIKKGDGTDIPNSDKKTDPDSKPNAENIDIYGRIVDSYTLEAIPGAVCIILKQGVTIEEFNNDPKDEMVLAYGEADQDGAFLCTDVAKGAVYSVVVGADGYLPIFEDKALDVPADWEGDMDLGDVNLEKEN